MSKRLYFAIVFGIWVFTVFVISWTGFLFTNDGPCHLFGALVNQEYDNPALDFSRYYFPSRPASSRGFVEIFDLFYSLSGQWMFAYQATVISCVTVWFVGTLSFAWVCCGEGRWPHLLLASFGFQTAYLMGTFPFLLGTSLAFLGFALWRHFESRHAVVAVVAAAVVFFFAARCHVFAAGVVGLLLGVDALSRGVKSTARAAIIGLPVLLVGFQSRAPTAHGWNGVYSPFPLAFTHLPDAFIPGPVWKTWPVLLLILYFAYTARGAKTQRMLWISAILCIFLTAILPRDFLSWEYAGWRFLPVGCVVALALAPDARAALVKAAVGAALALQLGWSTWFLVDQQEANAPLLGAIGALEPAPRQRFPIVRAQPRKMPLGISSYIHFGQMVTIETGGQIFYGHDTNPLFHWILLKDGPVIPEGANMLPQFALGKPGDATFDEAVSRASRFEGVAYYGYAEDAAFLTQAGYRITFQRDRLILADLVGCPLSVQVDGATAGVDVDVGFGRAAEAVSTFHLEPGDQRSHTLTVDRFLCGERWVRVRGAHQRCDARGGASLVCTLEPAEPAAGLSPGRDG